MSTGYAESARAAGSGGGIRALFLAPVREMFFRQLYFTGIQATAGVVLRGAAIGTLLIVYMIRMLDADVALTAKILLLVVFREAGPLFAAIFVILRSASAATSELALMGASGELRTLRRLGIRVFDYVLLPRLMAFPLATVSLTIYFQAVAILGAVLLAPLAIETTPERLLDELLAAASLWDVAYSVLKSVGFGVIIALVACREGLRAVRTEAAAVPRAVMRAVMRSVGWVMVFNALFAYLVFGVLLFGLIRAAD